MGVIWLDFEIGVLIGSPQSRTAPILTYNAFAQFKPDASGSCPRMTMEESELEPNFAINPEYQR